MTDMDQQHTVSSTALQTATELVAHMPGRMTQPRIYVCAALLTAQRPVCHQHIHHMVPHINRVSIYRVCEWLAQQNLIDVVVGKDGIRRYAWRAQRDSHHRHAHFHCENCGHTECLEGVLAPQAILPEGYHTRSVTVVVNGICAHCG